MTGTVDLNGARTATLTVRFCPRISIIDPLQISSNRMMAARTPSPFLFNSRLIALQIPPGKAVLKTVDTLKIIFEFQKSALGPLVLRPTCSSLVFVFHPEFLAGQFLLYPNVLVYKGIVSIQTPGRIRYKVYYKALLVLDCPVRIASVPSMHAFYLRIHLLVDILPVALNHFVLISIATCATANANSKSITVYAVAAPATVGRSIICRGATLIVPICPFARRISPSQRNKVMEPSATSPH